MEDDQTPEEIEQENQIDDSPTQPRLKKKHHGGRTFLIVLASIILVVVLIAGWYGFVPGLSDLMGATKPRDLGVKYTVADFESYKQKNGVSFNDFAVAPDNPNKPGKKTVFTNPITVSGAIVSQEELTAVANETNWLWMPIKNTQVRLSNNVVEISGNLNTTYINEFINFIGGIGYSQSDIDKAISLVGSVINNAPIYVKASTSILNDQLSFELQDISVGRITVPTDIASRVLSTGATNIINNADSFEAQSVSFKDGQMVFSGTYPKTVYVKTE